MSFVAFEENRENAFLIFFLYRTRVGGGVRHFIGGFITWFNTLKSVFSFVVVVADCSTKRTGLVHHMRWRESRGALHLALAFADIGSSIQRRHVFANDQLQYHAKTKKKHSLNVVIA